MALMRIGVYRSDREHDRKMWHFAELEQILTAIDEYTLDAWILHVGSDEMWFHKLTLMRNIVRPPLKHKYEIFQHVPIDTLTPLFVAFWNNNPSIDMINDPVVA